MKIEKIVSRWMDNNAPSIYAEGLSWYEALIILSTKINDLIDQINLYFNDDLEDIVTKILNEWLDDGTIQVIISEALQTQIDAVESVTNLLSLQLAQTIQLITPDMTREEIQSVLDNGGDFKFTKGEYLIDLPDTYENEVFKLKSNTHVVFDAGAVIRLTDHNALRYQMFSLENVENVVLENLNLDGSRNLNTATSGEWGMGIYIRGSKNIVVNNATIKNCWGDGVYVGSTTSNSFSENISLNNILCDNNRRQGISVISVKGLYGKNLKLINTNGTAPEAGIDFEPNNKNEVLEDIVIDHLTTYNNAGSGFLIAPLHFGAVKKKIDITVNDFNSENDQRGIYLLRFNGHSDGDVLFRNPVIRKSRSGSIGIRSISKNFSKITIDSPTIIDSNYMKQGSAVEGSGIAIYRGANDFIENENFRMGNININNPTFIKDEADSFYHIAALNFLNESDYIFDNINIKEIESGGKFNVIGVNLLNATNAITVKNEIPYSYFTGASPVLLNVWPNRTVTYSKIDINADKNVNIQLPNIASEHCIDLEITVSASGSYKQTILPPEGETIRPASVLKDGVLETTFQGGLNNGSRIRLRRRNNVWYVVDKIGAW